MSAPANAAAERKNTASLLKLFGGPAKMREERKFLPIDKSPGSTRTNPGNQWKRSEAARKALTDLRVPARMAIPEPCVNPTYRRLPLLRAVRFKPSVWALICLLTPKRAT